MEGNHIASNGLSAADAWSSESEQWRVRGTVLWGARGARDAGYHDGARSCGSQPHAFVIFIVQFSVQRKDSIYHWLFASVEY